jgi:hypothetical protein
MSVSEGEEDAKLARIVNDIATIASRRAWRWCAVA